MIIERCLHDPAWWIAPWLLREQINERICILMYYRYNVCVVDSHMPSTHGLFPAIKMHLLCFATGSKHWIEGFLTRPFCPSVETANVEEICKNLLDVRMIPMRFFGCSFCKPIWYLEIASKEAIPKNESLKTYNEIVRNRQIDLFHHLCIKLHMRGHKMPCSCRLTKNIKKNNSITPTLTLISHHIHEGKLACAFGLHGLISGGSLT